MSHTFCEIDRQTLFPLPPSMDNWLPEGHLAQLGNPILTNWTCLPILSALFDQGVIHASL